MKGGIGWNLRLELIETYNSSIWFLVTRNWYKTVSKLYQNLFTKILYKIIRNIKQITFNKNATNLKTTISQRSLRNSSLLLLLFELYIILIDIYLIILSIRPEHVTSTPTNGSALLLWRASVYITWPIYCTVIGGNSGHVIRIHNFYTVM